MRPIIGIITADIEVNCLKLNREYRLLRMLAPFSNVADIALKIDGILISGGSDLHPSYYTEDINYEIKIVERDRSGFELAITFWLTGNRHSG